MLKTTKTSSNSENVITKVSYKEQQDSRLEVLFSILIQLAELIQVVCQLSFSNSKIRWNYFSYLVHFARFRFCKRSFLFPGGWIRGRVPGATSRGFCCFSSILC